MGNMCRRPDLRTWGLQFCYVEPLLVCFQRLQSQYSVPLDEFLGGLIILIIINALCYYGIKNNNPKFMLPNLVLKSLTITGLIILMVCFTVDIFNSEGASSAVLIIIPIALFFLAGAYMYVLYRMHKLYKSIRDSTHECLPTVDDQTTNLNSVENATTN